MYLFSSMEQKSHHNSVYLISEWTIENILLVHALQLIEFKYSFEKWKRRFNHAILITSKVFKDGLPTQHQKSLQFEESSYHFGDKLTLLKYFEETTISYL